MSDKKMNDRISSIECDLKYLIGYVERLYIASIARDQPLVSKFTDEYTRLIRIMSDVKFCTHRNYDELQIMIYELAKVDDSVSAMKTFDKELHQSLRDRALSAKMVSEIFEFETFDDLKTHASNIDITALRVEDNYVKSIMKDSSEFELTCCLKEYSEILDKLVTINYVSEEGHVRIIKHVLRILALDEFIVGILQQSGSRVLDSDEYAELMDFRVRLFQLDAMRCIPCRTFDDLRGYSPIMKQMLADL